QILASFYLCQAPTLSSHLLRIIDVVCSQVGCRVDDLGGLAVGLGPGGFTSLRVGLATVQGLAMAIGKPLVGCSAFEALVALAEGLAASVARIGHGRLCASTPTAGPALKPLYIRAADARLPRHVMVAAADARAHGTPRPTE